MFDVCSSECGAPGSISRVIYGFLWIAVSLLIHLMFVRKPALVSRDLSKSEHFFDCLEAEPCLILWPTQTNKVHANLQCLTLKLTSKAITQGYEINC